jgi:hypothetical protein
MILKILIFLVAVVVLIVIIAFLALRYLRAEDTDNFDDLPAEPRRPARSVPDERRQVPAMAAATRGPGPAAEHVGGPGPERAPAGYRDRGSQPGRVAPDRRDGPAAAQRPLAASRARQRGQNGREKDWDALSDVDYWVELASEQRATDADSTPPPGRRAADQSADGRRRQAEGRPPRRRVSANGQQAPLSGRQPAPSRASGPRPVQPSVAQPPVAQPPGARAAVPEHAVAPPPAAQPPVGQPFAAAPPPAAQPPVGQPFAAAHQPGAQPRIPAASRSARPADYGRPRQAEPRSQHAPGRYRGMADDDPTVIAAAPSRFSGPLSASPPAAPPGRPAASPAPSPAASPTPPPLASPVAPPLAASAVPPVGRQTAVGQPHPAPPARGHRTDGRSRSAVVSDDDPLTSPSFPAISTSDSRSYRTRRSDSQPRSAPRDPAAYGEPSQQPASRPAAAGWSPGPDAYGQPGTGAPVPGAGNPYGSYVSQSPAAYQPPAATDPDASNPNGFPAGGRPPLTPPEWPGGPARFSDGPAATPGLPAANGGYSAGNPYPQTPYPDPASYPQPAYRAEQHDQRGYASPDIARSLDSYQGYPRHGSPAR